MCLHLHCCAGRRCLERVRWRQRRDCPAAHPGPTFPPGSFSPAIPSRPAGCREAVEGSSSAFAVEAVRLARFVGAKGEPECDARSPGSRLSEALHLKSRNAAGRPGRLAVPRWFDR